MQVLYTVCHLSHLSLNLECTVLFQSITLFAVQHPTSRVRQNLFEPVCDADRDYILDS